MKPALHVHAYDDTPAVHVPPFLQGDEPQEDVLASHVTPVNPVLHVHLKLPTPLPQVPPFLQGDEAHSLMSVWHWMPV